TIVLAYSRRFLDSLYSNIRQVIALPIFLRLQYSPDSTQPDRCRISSLPSVVQSDLRNGRDIARKRSAVQAHPLPLSLLYHEASMEGQYRQPIQQGWDKYLKRILLKS